MLPCCVHENDAPRKPCLRDPCACKICKLKRDAAKERAQCPCCRGKADSEARNKSATCIQFLGVIVEILGRVLLVVITVLCFWATILGYGICIGKKLYEWSKKNRLLAIEIASIIIFIFICTLTTCYVLRYRQTKISKASARTSIMDRLCTWRIFSRLKCCLNKIKSPLTSSSKMEKLCAYRILNKMKCCSNKAKTFASSPPKVEKSCKNKFFSRCGSNNTKSRDSGPCRLR